MIRVFIVDDHAIIRHGLKRILDEAGDIECVGEAVSGDEALNKNRKCKWDVMLLDISMPDKNGGEVLKLILKANKDARVLILSMYEEDQYAVRLMKSGAAGYLTKDVAPQKLLEAIRIVASGKKYIGPALGELLLQECSSESNKALHATLSDREYQVLKLIGSGKKVSEIADELCLSVKTVSTYRTHILSKMKLKNNAEITVYVVRNELLQLP